MEILQLLSAMNFVMKRWMLVECAAALQRWMYVCEVKRKRVMHFAKHLVNATRFYFTFWARWASRMKRVARANAARIVKYAKVIFDARMRAACAMSSTHLKEATPKRSSVAAAL